MSKVVTKEDILTTTKSVEHKSSLPHMGIGKLISPKENHE